MPDNEEDSLVTRSLQPNGSLRSKEYEQGRVYWTPAAARAYLAGSFSANDLRYIADHMERSHK